MSLAVECVADAASFARRVAPLVAADPVGLSILATVVDRWVREPRAAAQGATGPPGWFAVHDGERLVAAAMHVPPRPVHIPADDPAVGAALAAYLAGRDRGGRAPVTAVGGRPTAARTFADLWSERLGTTWQVQRRLLGHDLPHGLIAPRPAAGRARLAAESDMDVVTAGMVAMIAELGDGPAPGLEPEVAAGRVWVWEVAGEVVSQAYRSTAHAGIARVSGVWTPPQHRRHGYASSVTHAVTADVAADGLAPMLFTDADNPTTNAIYRALGYRPVADFLDLRLA